MQTYYNILVRIHHAIILVPIWDNVQADLADLSDPTRSFEVFTKSLCGNRRNTTGWRNDLTYSMLKAWP